MWKCCLIACWLSQLLLAMEGERENEREGERREREKDREREGERLIN